MLDAVFRCRLPDLPGGVIRADERYARGAEQARDGLSLGSRSRQRGELAPGGQQQRGGVVARQRGRPSQPVASRLARAVGSGRTGWLITGSPKATKVLGALETGRARSRIRVEREGA